MNKANVSKTSGVNFLVQLNHGVNTTIPNVYENRWVKQIFIGSKKGWFNLLLHDTDLSYLTALRSQWCLSVANKLKPFWKIVFLY